MLANVEALGVTPKPRLVPSNTRADPVVRTLLPLRYGTPLAVPPLCVIVEDVVRVVTDAAAGVVAPTVPLMLKAAAVPVMLVPTNALGVPSAGVTKVGLVDNTKLPDPVLVPTPVPPLVTLSNGPVSNNKSIESKSEFIFDPQESVEAPTSGFVSNRFVVVVSAMCFP
jgi:hypothetical protein